MGNKFLFVSCEEAKQICDKAQYNEATFLDKLKLNIRLSWCRVTRAYFKRNSKLTEVINASNADCLKPKERNAMEEKFKEELAKH